MSIKDRMEVGQTWEAANIVGFLVDYYMITAVGEDGFLCIPQGCKEQWKTFEQAKNLSWTLTYDSDGNHVRGYCGWGKWVDGELRVCTINHKHEGDHQWPQEEVEDPEQAERVEREKPTCPEQSRGKGVIRVDAHFRDEYRGDYVTRMDIADGYGNYLCWEDDLGILRGLFRLKGQPNSHCYSLGKEQWETGDWEVIRPVKLWFEGESP